MKKNKNNIKYLDFSSITQTLHPNALSTRRSAQAPKFRKI